MSGWDALSRELDAWGEAGKSACLWWRDDDAAEPTAALVQLFAVVREHGVPLTLAVIPALAGEALAGIVAAEAAVTPVQHGYAHIDHAPDGEKGGELGASRSVSANLEDLARGWQEMRRLFGDAAHPVLVPPWNRIDPALVPRLPRLGYCGLSTYGARRQTRPALNLIQVNTHADIINWRGNRRFVGEVKAYDQLVDHLKARRLGEADTDEPTGLLTHHLAHDADAWDFLSQFLARSGQHPAARWLAAREVFSPIEPSTAGEGRQ
jgi:hypothetical protein